MWGLQKNVWNTCFTWQTDEAYNRYQVFKVVLQYIILQRLQ